MLSPHTRLIVGCGATIGAALFLIIGSGFNALTQWEQITALVALIFWAGIAILNTRTIETQKDAIRMLQGVITQQEKFITALTGIGTDNYTPED